MKNTLAQLSALCLVLILITGCSKPDLQKIPDEMIHFAPGGKAFYDVISAEEPPFEVKVGLTTPRSTATAFTVKVSSPTGAVEGTEYILVSGLSGSIPAGEVLGSIRIKGDPAIYASGRIDTLVLTLVSADVRIAEEFDTAFTVILRKPCYETNFNINELLGTYANTKDNFGGSVYGPYETTISNVTSTGETSCRIRVTNIFDAGWESLLFDLDWSDPENRTVAVVPKASVAGSDGGILDADYSGYTFAVQPYAGRIGTFSICNQTLVLEMQLGYTGVGFFTETYTVFMAR